MQQVEVITICKGCNKEKRSYFGSEFLVFKKKILPPIIRQLSSGDLLPVVDLAASCDEHGFKVSSRAVGKWMTALGYERARNAHSRGYLVP